MTARMLEIMLDGAKIGSILLNGPLSTNLKKVKITNITYDGLTKNNLLVQGQDYKAFGYGGYIKILTNYLKQKLGEEANLQEKEISPSLQRMLIKQNHLA